jgi:hypothetical protein
LAGAIGEGTFFFGLLLIGFLVLIALVTSQLVPIPGAPRYEAGSGLWLGVVVTTSFILIGAGGLLLHYSSWERRPNGERRWLKRLRSWIPVLNGRLPTRNIPRFPNKIRFSSAPAPYYVIAYR